MKVDGNQACPFNQLGPESRSRGLKFCPGQCPPIVLLHFEDVVGQVNAVSLSKQLSMEMDSPAYHKCPLLGR